MEVSQTRDPFGDHIWHPESSLAPSPGPATQTASCEPNKPSRKNFRKYSPRSQKGLGKSLMKTRTLLAVHCVAHRGQRVRNVACNVCTSAHCALGPVVSAPGALPSHW